LSPPWRHALRLPRTRARAGERTQQAWNVARAPAAGALRITGCVFALARVRGGGARYSAVYLTKEGSTMSSSAIAVRPPGGVERAQQPMQPEARNESAALVPTRVTPGRELAALGDIAPPNRPPSFALARKDNDRLPVPRFSNIVMIRPGSAVARPTAVLPPRRTMNARADGPGPLAQAAGDMNRANLIAQLLALVEFIKHMGEVIRGAT
jgi:hypothetical protein